MALFTIPRGGVVGPLRLNPFFKKRVQRCAFASSGRSKQRYHQIIEEKWEPVITKNCLKVGSRSASLECCEALLKIKLSLWCYVQHDLANDTVC